LGWIRANILYEKAMKLPETGSPMETLFILLWKMKQDIEFQKVRTLVQGLYSLQPTSEDKSVQDAFEDFRKAFQPFTEKRKDEEKQDLRAALLREVSKGPIRVTVQEDFTRRKMSVGLAKGEKAMAHHRVLQDMGRLERIDILGKAKKRPRVAS